MSQHLSTSRPVKAQPHTHISTLELGVLLSAVVLCYCVLYGPQVILNQWVSQYNLSTEWASALVYITLLPMSLAPLSYGYLLGQKYTKKLIMGSLVGLAVITLGLAFVQSPKLILGLRFVQGLVLPIVMTSVMSRLSSVGGLLGKKLISFYLCATVIGGLAGRLVTGYFSQWYSLETLWMVWALLLLIHIPFIQVISKHQVPFNRGQINLDQLTAIIKQRQVQLTLVTSALMFGVFAAALNLLPIRANELGLGHDSSSIANRYWGYLCGALVALNAQTLDRTFGYQGRFPALGMLIISGSLLWGTLTLSYAPLYIMVLGLCLGLFMTHPILAAYITQIHPNERGLMSGLYVSAYYIGGVIFSGLASLGLSHFGWGWTLYTLAIIASLASVLLIKLFKN